MFANELVRVNPDALHSTIEFLTAMVTPTLLMTATGSLVLSTSTRLGAVVEHVRELEARLTNLITEKHKESIDLYELRVDTVVNLLDKTTSRSRLLQRAMVTFYYGLGFFVLTSATIALAAFFNTYRWVPIPVGIVGIFCLLWGSILMLAETRIATAAVNAEMDFTWTLANYVAPKEIISKYIYDAHGKRRLRATIEETLEKEHIRESHNDS